MPTWTKTGNIKGPPGSNGAPGSDGASAFTTTTAGFSVPPVGSTVVANVVATTWATPGEVVWVQDAASPGVAGPMQITAKTSTSLTLLNIAASAAQMYFGETPTGAIDGSNTSYTTLYPYLPNLLSVFLNGVRQRRTSDYTETGTQTFSFLNAPLPGDSVSVDYIHS